MGMGHLARMLRVASLLVGAGLSLCFCGRLNAASRKILEGAGYPYRAFGEPLGEEEIMASALAERGTPGLWVFDLLDTRPAWIRFLQGLGVRVVCVDDRGAGLDLADEVILTMPFAFMDRRVHTASERIRYGLEYMILPEERFGGEREGRVAAARGSCRIGVSMGGSDTHGSTVVLARALDKVLTPQEEVVFFTGPSFEHGKDLEEALASSRLAWQIRPAVPDLLGDLKAMDVVLTSGGMTLFEAIGMGLPVLAFAGEPFEQDNIRFLAEQGACVDLGCVCSTSSRELIERLRRGLGDGDVLAGMGRRGAELMAGSGPGPVVRRLAFHLERRS